MNAGSYYEATVGDRPLRSALEAHIDAEVCIIGAGFAGLATALGLLERGVRDVVVLEAEQVGFGASGRNGGFVFGGFSLDCADLLAQLGPVSARSLYGLTRCAVTTIRERIRRHAITCDAVEGGALWVNWFKDEAILRRQQQLMASQFGVAWQFVGAAQLRGLINSPRNSCCRPDSSSRAARAPARGRIMASALRTRICPASLC